MYQFENYLNKQHHGACNYIDGLIERYNSWQVAGFIGFPLPEFRGRVAYARHLLDACVDLDVCTSCEHVLTRMEAFMADRLAK